VTIRSKGSIERALVIDESAYGKDHVEVAAALVKLGVACGSFGDYKQQKDLSERALVIQESAYGKDHVNVANTLVNLGNAYGS